MCDSSVQEFKIVVLGGGDTATSALMGLSPAPSNATTGNFLEEYDPTIEDSYRKHVMIDDEPCLLDILDTSGKDEFSSMQDQWMREGQGFIIFYSITSRPTFDAAILLKEKVLRCKEEAVPMVFVGNKIELEESRQVSTQEARDMVNKISADGSPVAFFEISTEKRINCEEAVHECVRMIRRQKAKDSSSSNANEQDSCCVIL